jgi:anaerobic selenocysteine-containing dehydrogenase
MGEIKALFVQGLDLLADTPLASGVGEALDRLDLLVSFSHAMDATAHRAHYHLPDHHPLESWGYQRAFVGSDRWAVTAIQPAQPARGDSRATLDVLLAAVREIGGDLAQALPFEDERAFLQHVVASLHQRAGDAPIDPGSAWDHWLQKGGWWSPRPALMPPVLSSSRRTMLEVDLPESEDGFDLQLLPYPYDGAEAVNFVNGNEALPYVDIHPATAGEFGVADGERVALSSPFGAIEAHLRLVADIRRGVLALPLSSPDTGHTSAARSNSAYRLLGPAENASGNLAYLATRVQLQKLSHS